MSTPLKSFMARHIRTHGPMHMGHFMSHALGHPRYGYYMGRDPLGVAGDFTTAPEISQMFGEMLGAWIADMWVQMGRPGTFALVEAGPGRGTLLADALRATRSLPGFHAAVQVHLLEMSMVLREMQAQALAPFMPEFHESLETIPSAMPVIMVGNEFLDALPIRQLVKTENGWAERVVSLDDEPDSDVLIYGQIPALPGLGRVVPAAFQAAKAGRIFEFSPARDDFIQEVCAVLEKQGGAALFMDYGHEEPGLGDTLHAISNHERVEVLAHVGQCDVSANVNFGQVKTVAQSCGAKVSGPVEQGAFLKALGIEVRARGLSAKASDSQREDLEKALHRLVDSDQMGTLFKAIGLTYDTTLTLAGF